jgi:hypothetical protein
MKIIATSGGVPFRFLMATSATVADEGARYSISEEAFVLARMNTSGRDTNELHKSGAVDAIKAQLPYQQYSEAILVFAMRQPGGKKQPSIAALLRCCRSTYSKSARDDYLRPKRRGGWCGQRTHAAAKRRIGGCRQETSPAGVAVHCIISIGVISENEQKSAAGFSL